MLKPDLSIRWRIWCGQTMLGWWCLGMLVICILLVLGLYALSLFNVAPKELQDTAVMLVLMLSFTLSCGYSIFRVAYFHPLFHRSYGEWLLRQPWAPSQALPLGPWHFAWQDGVYLTLLTVLMSLVMTVTRLFIPVIGEPTQPIWLSPFGLTVVTFIVSYAFLVLLKAAFLREPVGAYSLAIFFGCLSFVWVSWYLVGAFLIALPLAAHVSSQRMLSRLRFYDEQQRMPARQSFSPYFGIRIWPYTDLLGVAPSPLIPPIHTFLIAMLAGFVIGNWANFYPLLLWWLGLEMAAYELEHFHDATLVAVIMCAILLSALRLLIYWLAGSSPFGILARFKLGRPIVPGYDVVLVAPLVTLAIAVAMPRLLFALHVPAPVVAGVSIFTMVLTAFGMGPTLDTWRHVGHHRMRDLSKDRRTKVSTQ